jgi:hypothetical protein
MKTVLDKTARDELISRINSVTENNKATWGKMTPYQMLKHCAIAEESYLGKKKYKRALIGRLIGKKVLKNLLKDETPMMRNVKSIAAFTVTDNGDIEVERNHWITLLEEYENFPAQHVTHWFFGPMTKEQIGYFSYKHADHHLRQFGC